MARMHPRILGCTSTGEKARENDRCAMGAFAPIFWDLARRKPHPSAGYLIDGADGSSGQVVW